MGKVENFFMTSADFDDFTIPESTLMQRTGISAFELKKWRGKTVRGEHWERGGSGRYLWSESGVAALQALLSPGMSPEPVLEKMPAATVLTVVRARTPRVLHVERAGQPHDYKHPICLWLPQPRARLFLPRMLVLGRLRPGRDDLYDFEGNPAAPEKGRRFPRRIGTW
jgi:hypothetical protein